MTIHFHTVLEGFPSHCETRVFRFCLGLWDTPSFKKLCRETIYVIKMMKTQKIEVFNFNIKILTRDYVKPLSSQNLQLLRISCVRCDMLHWTRNKMSRSMLNILHSSLSSTGVTKNNLLMVFTKRFFLLY